MLSDVFVNTGSGESRYKRFFEKVLKTWNKNLIDFTNENRGQDHLYWYNENATTSTLATALARAWKDLNLLQDFQVMKNEGKGKNEIGIKGRPDLWFESSDCPVQFILESKQIWRNFRNFSINEEWKILRKPFDSAKKQLAKNRDYMLKNNIYGLYSIYIVPSISNKEASIEKAKKNIAAFCENLREIIETGAKNHILTDVWLMSYAFPQRGWEPIEDYNRVYPGIIFLAKYYDPRPVPRSAHNPRR